MEFTWCGYDIVYKQIYTEYFDHIHFYITGSPNNENYKSDFHFILQVGKISLTRYFNFDLETIGNILRNITWF